jgi:hypothetical protein
MKPISGPIERSIPPLPERIDGVTAMAPMTSGTATLTAPVRKRGERRIGSWTMLATSRARKRMPASTAGLRASATTDLTASLPKRPAMSASRFSSAPPNTLKSVASWNTATRWQTASSSSISVEWITTETPPAASSPSMA